MTDGRIAAEKFRSTEMKYKRYKISGKDIYIAGDETEICYIGYTEPEGEEVETPLIKEAFSQIEEYLQGKRKEFVLPLRDFGESRSGRVWKEIAKIPYGKTRNIQRALQENGIRQGIQIYRKDMRRKSSCNSCTVSQSCRSAGIMRICGRSRIKKRTA